MKLSDCLSAALIDTDLPAGDKGEVMGALARLFALGDGNLDEARVTRALLERENIMSTALGHGVAIPHAKTAAARGLRVCLGITSEPVDFGAKDGSGTQIFFTLLAPEDASGQHLKLLASISRLCGDVDFCQGLLATGGGEAALALINQWEQA